MGRSGGIRGGNIYKKMKNMLRHLLLFESYNRSFRTPDFHVMPKSIDKNKLYLVSISTGDGDLFYIVADYNLLVRIYDTMNYRLIIGTIIAFHALVKGTGSNWGNLDENLFDRISILDVSNKFGPPIDVWVALDDSNSIFKKISDIKKGRSGVNDMVSGPMIGVAYFDEGRKTELSDIVFDKDTPSNAVLDVIYGDGDKSFYVEFSEINSGIVLPHAANEFNFDNLIFDMDYVLDQYLTSDSEDLDYLGFRDFNDDQVDEIMGYLINNDASKNVIDKVKLLFPQIDNREGVEYYYFDWYQAKINIKRRIGWSEDNGTLVDSHPISIPVSLFDIVMEKLPKSREEYINMINATGQDEIDKMYSAMDRKLEYRVDRSTVFMYAMYPNLKSVKKSKKRRVMKLWKDITKQKISNASDFAVWCLVFSGVDIL